MTGPVGLDALLWAFKAAYAAGLPWPAVVGRRLSDAEQIRLFEAFLRAPAGSALVCR